MIPATSLSLPASRLKVFLLPGLDGTGRLLDELSLRLAHKNLAPIIMSYPNTSEAENWAYADYITHVVENIKSQTSGLEKYAIMAESFSGPILAGVYEQLKENITHMIFVASFVKNPIVGASILQKINLDKLQEWLAIAHSDRYGTAPRPETTPAAYSSSVLPRSSVELKANAQNFSQKLPSLSSLPLKLVIAGGLGFKSTAALRQKIKEVVLTLSPSLIMARIKLILNLDNQSEEILNFKNSSARILYVSGRFDTIILPHAFKTIKNLHPQTECVKISAPHFINQTFPREAASLIADFINNRKVENLPWHVKDLLPAEQ